MNGSGSKKQLKTSYRASPRLIRPLYTGGPVLLTKDGERLITTMGEEVLITEMSTGIPIAKVTGDGSAITALALSYNTSPPTLITAHLSTALRFYPLSSSTSSSSSSSLPSLSYSRQQVKAHSAPILTMAVSPDDTLLTTGSSDGMVKVWDTAGGYVTHIYRGHGGPVSALKFYFNEDKSRMELFTGSTDGKVRIFDLLDPSARMTGGDKSGKPRHVLEGHVSVVRGIDISPDGRWLVTGGRDKVVLLWDLSSEKPGSKKGKQKAASSTPQVVNTVVLQEQVESLGLLPDGLEVNGEQIQGRLLCYTGGDGGSARVWDVIKGTEVVRMTGVEGVDEMEDEEDEQRGIIQILFDSQTSTLLAIHADQNIIIYSLSTASVIRQIIGYNDEIIDAAFLSTVSSSAPSHLALATNSSLIKIYSTSTFDARLLSGHSDMTLCLTTSSDNQWLATGSKDQTARLWAPTNTHGDEQATWRCIAVCEGHAESIGAVAFSKRMDEKTGRPKYLITASQDRTIKLWDLSTVSEDSPEPVKPRSLATLRAHEKDINSLDVSPNDRFLVSGSQDKLVKLFDIEWTPSSSGVKGGLKLVGTCKGHRRGVWTVKLSPTDRIVASGAADRSIKLWSLDDMTCLKTFEGHTNSVLRVDFLSSGMQLVTSSSDGLVKLWNIKDEECVKTLDNHEDKVWALAISPDEKTIVSAGADSVATFWEDSTQIEQTERNEALIQAVQSEQDFTNYVALKDYKRAIQLALAMSQPGRLLNLFTTVLSTQHDKLQNSAGRGISPEIDHVIRTMSNLDLSRLLKHVRDWNSNARTSPVAQSVLNAIFKLRSPDDIIAAFDTKSKPPVANGTDEDGMDNVDEATGKAKSKLGPEIGFRELIDGLIPYTERHFARIERLVQDSYALDYVVGEMDGGVFGGEIMDVD